MPKKRFFIFQKHRGPRRGQPLHVHITLLFVTLVLVLGILLIGYNHLRNRQIILSASESLFQRIAQDVRTIFAATHEPAIVGVSLLTHTALVTATSLEERRRQLPLLAQLLAEQPYLSGIEVGYANGDFFILRPLRDATGRQRFQAPANAEFVVDDISGEAPNDRVLTRLFLDGDLRKVDRRISKAPDYDPRTRPWYRLALAHAEPVLTRPYLYHFSRQVGVTVARRAVGQAVVAADLTLTALSRSLPEKLLTPSAELILYSDRGEVLAYRDPAQLVIPESRSGYHLAHLEELHSRPVQQAAARLSSFQRDGTLLLDLENGRWRVRVSQLQNGPGMELYLAILMPERELLSQAYRIAGQGSLIALGMVVLSLPLIGLFARRIGRPLRNLADQTRRIRQFDFSGTPLPDTGIREVEILGNAIEALKITINRFLELITALAMEQDFDRILERFTREARAFSGADVTGVMLLDEDRQRLLPRALQLPVDSAAVSPAPLSLDDPAAAPLRKVLQDNAPLEWSGDAQESGWLMDLIDDINGQRDLHLVLLPLASREGETMGIFFLASLSGASGHDDRDVTAWQHFMTTLGGFAAVSLETRRLLASRKALLDGFIQVIAAAIDAKSPYTGGHCQRVPELTRMLDQAAASSDAPPFRDYRPTEGDREALHIAAWLHDCGKVTTPEYVVDKATRLETLYNRIHEIRTRFEVLKRDAWIRYWQGLAQGGNESELKRRLDHELASLDDDFHFVAQCNSGEQVMDAARRARLRRIARRSWMRTLDDTLGLSAEELRRKGVAAASPLPVREPLLADRPEHRIPWEAGRQPLPANGKRRFRMQPPDCRLDLGELHNLTVERGTLTAEERFLINQHIVQTLIMLDQLPYPRHLRQVPLIAGTHHEKMDGTGYPLGLSGKEIPLSGRMMAIADIFEALTAGDRPYKPAKKLSEAIHILWRMKEEGHIDPDLFELFLRSGVYLEYAKRHLRPEQIDAVALDDYLP